MRTGAAAEHVGYFHETAFYRSDEELLDIVLPVLAGGAAAGEPTFVSLDDDHSRVVRAALGPTAGVTFVPRSDQYARPAAAIKRFRDLFAAQVAAGAEQIRVVGAVPHPGTGAPWDWWARYEAAVNVAFEEFPLWGLCPYDLRTTPDHVLEDVIRTHPHLAATDGSHTANDRYEDPVRFLARRPPVGRDPLELGPPAVELIDPVPAAARRAAQRVGEAAGLDPTTLTDLAIAVSEATDNAERHGRAPVRVRVWGGDGRVVVTVTDGGDGPRDPFAGLLPAPAGEPAGRGLWIVHQLCDHVTMGPEPGGGFTLRLVAGDACLVA